MPDTYTSQFSGEEIDAALRAAQLISGASTLAELRKKLEIRGDTIPVSAEDSTLISDAVKYITNPNLLDNWYFGRPVNQRGKTEYTAAGYTVDRWKMQLDIGVISAGSDGLILDATANALTLVQFFESDLLRELAGNTLTWSVMYTILEQSGAPGGLGYTIPGNYYAQAIMSGDVSKLCVASGSISAPTNLEIPAQMYIPKGCKIKLLAAKLELGTTQTLAHQENGVWVLNEIPDFGEQLRRCTYYAEKVESADTPAITNSTFVPSGATSAVFILPYARKRTVPAINFNDVSNYRVIARSISGGTTAFFVTAISPLDVGRTKAAILVSFNATDQGYYCFLQRSDNAPAGYAFISADL
jgi:hypothetical protein